MANLEFCYKHNMVAYLKKPTVSEGFQEIADFLNGSHIRFALIKNPTIYVSLIKKFWQAATVRTVDNREQEITAIVDGKEFTITEASVRRHLQLADVEGISALPTTEIFDQLSLMRVVWATTTAASLDAAQASGNITKTQSTSIPNVPLPQGIGTGGSPRIDGFMYYIVLESGLLGGRLEANKEDDEEDLEDSSKQGRMIEEIDQDAGITLVTPTKDSSQEDQPKDYGEVSTASRLFSTTEESVSTAGALMPVSTAGMVQEVNISIPSPIVVKDNGKGIMTDSKDEQTKRTKLQQEQDRLGHEVAVRLQEELDEEERQRMARVHVAAQSFTEEEWENIRARVEADEELTQRLQAEERYKYNEVNQAKMLVDLINQRKRYFAAQKAKAKRNKPMTQAQQRNYMMNYIKHMGSHTLQQLKRYSFDELKELFETTMKNANTFVSMETEDKGRASELAAGSSQAQITNSAEVGSSKRGAEVGLDHEVPVEEFYIEALHVKYLIIDWEVYSEDTRRYWKIIRVGNHTEVYQIFADMLKKFNRDGMVKL
ncbi:hypothetical protein Tco_1182181 [Tanacetum coccineum]